MKQEFIEKLVQDSLDYPFGKPSENIRKWEDLSLEEQENWNALAQTREMKIYVLASKAFELKQSQGVPEDVSEVFLAKEYKFTDKDMKIFRESFKHFMEGHAIKSRKGMAQKFNK